MYPECQLLPGPDVFYFMPPYHAIFTLAFWTIQNRKKYPEIIDIPDDSFISTIPSSLVVKLISINKIWNLVIGQGFYSANKIWLCKNSWNLNTKLQTWDTRGAARWKLGFWGNMMRNQSKSVTKRKVSSNSILAWFCRQSLFCECDKKLLGTFCNVSDFICLAVSKLVWWRQWFKGYLCCGKTPGQTKRSVFYQNVTITPSPNTQTRIWTLQKVHHTHFMQGVVNAFSEKTLPLYLLHHFSEWLMLM